MFIYRLEVTFEDESAAAVVVIHDSEEKAFRSAQNQIERHFIPVKPIKELAIVEKKPAEAGRSYVIES
ncbi:DUF3906 family protein [Aneurinibacillus aneurinilyticus]|jgi:hypothetical protein|uniref:DUF3906 family protein n=2 Tax=Aneurinibacillus aneurinilyticus TaxID=1391 RepID=A0A848CVW8_ANEAE|nr:DUF3906 family protein [Aneurinibacillus aneurinilyticus]ERI06653.1 hypothetical protein HMPREF0083_05277 [Aneurinibacillus aneurinilyticus ATCC 12856]MCI1694935.1 DUF3906 family protein [Aneurinibacillus aneurinilyticus]MED0707052.1 DUF3906 family protein [Aneurinibacillus aneurinilyticus]MED0723504.1 DUF3906 family protein [Aneurinibacillus aneurinilyticus]MED0732879.1 DUF3906 family protein [Aneurinibacillus aneurinilyticus]